MSATDPILQELFDATREMMRFKVGSLPSKGWLRDCDPCRLAVDRLDKALKAFDGAAAGEPTYGLYLDLSSAHLTERTRLLLDMDGPGAWPVPGHKGEYGWFLFAPDDAILDEEPIPADLDQVCRYARSRGVTHVLIDADAGIDPNLPTYEG